MRHEEDWLDADASALGMPGEVHWREYEDGLWVAHRGGAYFGCIDTSGVDYTAYDAYGEIISRFATLHDAMAGLSRTDHPAYWARQRRRRSVPLAAATVAGAASLAMALTAGAMAPLL